MTLTSLSRPRLVKLAAENASRSAPSSAPARRRRCLRLAGRSDDKPFPALRLHRSGGSLSGKRFFARAFNPIWWSEKSPGASMPKTEADTCRMYVLPKLYEAGWTDEQINEQHTFTNGRVIPTAKRVRRGPQKRADYRLRYTRDFPIAIVEAKASYKTAGKRLQQAKEYAEILDLKFAYAANGKEIIEFDFLTGLERSVNTFPSPAELWCRLRPLRRLPEHPKLRSLPPLGEHGRHRRDCRSQHHDHHQTSARPRQSVADQPPGLRLIAYLPLELPFRIRPGPKWFQGVGDAEFPLDPLLGLRDAKQGVQRGSAETEEFHGNRAAA